MAVRFLQTFLTCWLMLTSVAKAQGELVVIVNPAVSLRTVSTRELSALFLGESTNIRGVNLKPVTYVAGNPLRGVFEGRVLGLTAEKFAEHWRSKRFLGNLTKPPTAFRSAQAVKRFVAEERGAIGYIIREDLDATVRPVPLSLHSQD